MIENNQSPAEKQTFLTNIKNVVEILESNQTEAVVVGGIALRAAMGKDVEFKRSNGTTPDIDMIGLGPNPENIQKSVQEIKQYQKSNLNCPDIGLEPVIFANKPKSNYPMLEMLSGLRKDDNGRFFLTFRSLDKEISDLTMIPVSRKYDSVDIFTLPQETILYRYLVRMGYYKPKDISKVEEFRHYLNINGSDSPPPKLYVPYIEFAHDMREKHPHIISLTKFYWNLDQKIGGRISGASGPIYKMIGLFRK